MEKEVQVVMLPRNTATSPNEYFLNKVNDEKLEWNNWMKAWSANPQYLYFISNDEIKKGDIYMYVETKHIQVCILSPVDPVNAKKIVASTNPSLGLPAIQQSFIEAYVKANGKIEKVSLEMRLHPDCNDCHNFGDEWGIKDYILKLTPQNEVIVVSNLKMIDNSVIDFNEDHDVDKREESHLSGGGSSEENITRVVLKEIVVKTKDIKRLNATESSVIIQQSYDKELDEAAIKYADEHDHLDSEYHAFKAGDEYRTKKVQANVATLKAWMEEHRPHLTGLGALKSLLDSLIVGELPKMWTDEDNWINIRILPKVGKLVLFLINGLDIYVGMFHHGELQVWGAGRDSITDMKVTHWQPLPKVPEELWNQ